jgi:signal transduction histidine kinase
MNVLIDDLLSFASISSPNSFVATDLNEIIDGILSDLELLIDEKQAKIEVSRLPLVDAIPGLMRQLFQNIISNALKFSKADVPAVVTIRSEVFVVAEAMGGSLPGVEHCRIDIEDNGIGFKEIYASKIFTLFQRLHTTEYEGTGIGLAIAKKIVEKHNGSITARSTPGKGSVFSIVLPVRQASTSNKTDRP